MSFWLIALMVNYTVINSIKIYMKQLSKVGKIASLLFFVSIIGLIIGLRRCRKYDSYISRIEPIDSKFDIPFILFELDANRDTTLILGTGTSLKFLSGTFVTKNGKSVNGKIQIKVKEFHDPATILRAGIPMRLKSDRDAFLQSSGMLEIRAYLNDEELEVGSGKAISAELASFRSSKEHRLYFLKNNNDWQPRDTFLTVPNARKKYRINELNKLRSLNYKIERNADIVFELYGDEEYAPELEPWKGQKWKIAKEDVSPTVREALRINWDSVKIVQVNDKKFKYKLFFWKTMFLPFEDSSVTKKFVVDVTPFNETLTKGELAIEMKNRFLKEDSVKKEIEFEIARLNKEADLMNSFKINQMGIWNVDRALRLTDFIPIKASFDFESTLKKSQRVRLFCILKDDNSVIDFPNWQNEPIYLSKDRPTQIVAVLPNGNAAYVDFVAIQNQLYQKHTAVTFPTRKMPIKDFLTLL